MPGRSGKVTARKLLVRQASPEIPSPVKTTESNSIDNDDDIENQMPIESKDEPLPVESHEPKTDLNPMTILLANGQPLLTNFEEKYLIDLILKSTNKDIETILQEKIHFILQMNYGSQSSFNLNSSWIYDFLLKHFQTLIDHIHSSELFDKILQKKFDKNNSIIAFKHWQLQTLVNEHSKKSHQSSTITKKRRMTVRHIDFK
jgi:hypothetical protein